jgi:hypothetical protein
MSFELSSAVLHILAMAFMLLDHLWATVVPGNEWMTCVGRLAFPIFAFLLVEGFFHTRSRKKYAQRLLIFALISEIPFNLMCGGRIFFPIHQNVIWTFLIAFGLMVWNEKAKDAALWRRCVRFAVSFLVGLLVGLLTMVDYYGFGVGMVLVFYLFRGDSWRVRLGQAVMLWWINSSLMGGLVYEFELLGKVWVMHQQAFAVLALIPIWLYQGRQGHKSKAFQYFCYAFYPMHMLILALIR